MDVRVVRIGSREFLDLDVLVIPLDRVRKFDFSCPDGGVIGKTVRIVTDDPEERICLVDHQCEAVKNFLSSKARSQT